MLNSFYVKSPFSSLVNICIFILLLCFSVSVFSTQTLKSKHLTLDEITKELKEVGSARFSVLFWDIYDSRLLTPSGTYTHSEQTSYIREKTASNKSSPHLLFEIRYLRDISKEDLINKTIEQWQHLGINERSYKAYIQALEALWPNITAGDNLSLLIEHNRSVFYYNNDLIGAVSNNKVLPFGALFLDIWLSPQTSQPELRKELLGISHY